MIYIDPQSCSNCHQVVTDKLGPDGKPMTVWVCEHCGTENKPAEQPVAAPAPAPVVEPAPVAPPVDVAAAQAEVTAAANQMPPVTPQA